MQKILHPLLFAALLQICRKTQFSIELFSPSGYQKETYKGNLNFLGINFGAVGRRKYDTLKFLQYFLSQLVILDQFDVPTYSLQR